jgi:uncharacterized protein (DUF952 family)
MSSLIYHITKCESWERERDGNEYRHPSLDSEGFIHCSLAEQIPETLEKFFPCRDGLVLLEISVEKLQSELRYENGFPHLHGPLNRDAVVAVRPHPPSLGT